MLRFSPRGKSPLVDSEGELREGARHFLPRSAGPRLESKGARWQLQKAFHPEFLLEAKDPVCLHTNQRTPLSARFARVCSLSQASTLPPPFLFSHLPKKKSFLKVQRDVLPSRRADYPAPPHPDLLPRQTPCFSVWNLSSISSSDFETRF